MISLDYLLKNKTKSNLLIQVISSTKVTNSKYFHVPFDQGDYFFSDKRLQLVRQEKSMSKKWKNIDLWKYKDRLPGG